ncbi:pentatricopeptide repeat-containing protein At4g02820, mitochondrial isoform X1 [Vicia villosa]|uniref:pentatricopeptide repeat-containing protein At4g02820, mitochondrial isoform X1 n=1 Tax=Vicia villosa TaxID=3911 RepID=UPI00273CE182|nr:pentatricopeptide repeat-containing protein At4g02820, mitochondrial isoform X1 [Vicia villosa]XP_058770876.1 pentatricopeptide repeat-containing protein At4g02820, mitochondrial isoform X1 [Vicia villosa]
MSLRSIGKYLALARHFSTEAARRTTSTAGSGGTGGVDTLGRRLLSLVYPKRSAVIAINKWKEEGHTLPSKYQLNRMVRELRKNKRFKHALEVCEWMTLQKDIKLVEGDYAVHLDLITKVRGLNSAEKFFEDLPDKMRGQPTCTALLHAYVQNNLVDKAEALVSKMSECGYMRSPLPYNHMMSLYISKGKIDKVPKLFEELEVNTSPDVVTFNLLLTACASENDVETAERVMLQLKKAKVDPDWVTYSTLTNLYIRNASVKNDCLEKAASTLKEMEKRTWRKTRPAYSSLLSLHANMGNVDEVNRIWKKMKDCFRKMSDEEYICMISSLVKLGDFAGVENLYREWESVSGTNDVRVSNLLLTSYVDQGQMEMAENFCNQLVEKGVCLTYTTWELLTRGYLKKSDVKKFLFYFRKAISSVNTWIPDPILVQEAFTVMEKQVHIEGAEQLLVILRNAGHVNTNIYNLFLKTYAAAGKMPLIVAERMKKDNVLPDEETHRLLDLTGKMCVSDVSGVLS